MCTYVCLENIAWIIRYDSSCPVVFVRRRKHKHNNVSVSKTCRVGEKKKNSLKQLQYMCVHSSSNWVCGSGVLFCNKCPSVAEPRFGPVRPNPV